MARSGYAVCAEMTRPINKEEEQAVRDLVSQWPVAEEARLKVKAILSVADCRIGVADGALLVEAPADKTVIVVDIDNPNDDWASIPWG